MAEQRRRRRRRVRPETEEVQEEQEVVGGNDDEPSDVEGPRRDRRSRRAHPEPDSTEDKPEILSRGRNREQDAATFPGDEVFVALLAAIPDGGAIIIERLSSNKYQVVDAATHLAAAKASTKGAKRLSNDIFHTTQYNEWLENWRKKTYEEKVEYADVHEIEWVRHDNHRVSEKNLGQAVREAEVGSKYVPGFETFSARKKAKEQLARGETVEGLEI